MSIFKTTKKQGEKLKTLNLNPRYYSRSAASRMYDSSNNEWGEWEYGTSAGAGVLCIKSDIGETKTTLSFQRELFGEFFYERIEKIYLTLPYGATENIYNGTLVITLNEGEFFEIEYDGATGNLILDITEAIIKGRSVVNISFQTKQDNTQVSFSAPILEVVEYKSEESSTTIKNFSLAESGVMQIDMVDGKSIVKADAISNTNSVIGLPIYNVFRKTDDNYNVGKNVLFNINEKLEKRTSLNETEYNLIYVGDDGERRSFKKTYYHFDENGNKVYKKLYAEAVTLDKDGRYYFNGIEVFLEMRHGNLKVIPEKSSNYNNISLYEKRTEEQKQIEEQFESYKKAVEDFVVVKKENVELIKALKEDLSYESLDFFKIKASEEENVVLTTGQAENLKSLYNQKENLDNNKTSLNNQDDTYVMQTNQNNKIIDCLQDQIDVLDLTQSGAMLQKDYLEAQKDNLGEQNTNISFQRAHIVTQLATINEQIALIEEQIQTIIDSGKENLEKLNDYYKEYYNLSLKVEEIERQTPVNFLTDGTHTKGFNKNGDLVIVYDSLGKYAVIEREKYALTTGTGYRIKRIYDEKENSVDFKYEGDGKLSSITDIKGNKTIYSYTGENLTSIKYANGKIINLEYTNDEITAFCDETNKITASILKTSTDNGETFVVKNIRAFNELNKESEDSIEKEISNIEVFCAGSNGNYTTITNDAQIEKYVFTEDGELTEYYVEQGGRVTKAERYEHVPYWSLGSANTDPHKLTVKAKKSSLNCALENYTFVDGDSERITLNQFEQPIIKAYSSERWSYDNTATKTVTVFYTYDDNEKLIEEREQIVYTSPAKTVNKYKKYFYTKFGAVSKIESYVLEDINTLGKDIEEFFYDENGTQIKSCKYNSFDTSSKFYTESVVDKTGKTLAEIDGLGEYKTEYLYNGDKVVAKTLPNGSVFAVEEDGNGNIIAVSNTSNNGEENSTSRVYKYGNLVELRSGNNVINYEYDGKGRKTKILLNGATIRTIVYSDNVEIDGVVCDKVTSTDAQNNVTEEIFDKEGKLLKTIKGDNTITYSYNSLGDIFKKIDSLSSEKIYYYDYENRYSNYYYGSLGGQSYSRDSYGRINKKTVGFNNAMMGGPVYNYTFADDGRNIVNQMTVNSLIENYEFDNLGRLTNIKQTHGDGELTKKYKYLKRGDHTTNLINAEYFNDKYSVREKTNYTYDNMGNITSISVNGKQTTKFEYDKLCRLIKETHIDSEKEICYTYDDNGNILSKTVNGEETQYRYYKNSDDLMYYGNTFLQYNTMGQPYTYLGKIFTWNNGLLTKIQTPPNEIIATFTYNGFNERLTKTVGDVTCNYIYNDGELLREIRGEDTIIYIYGKEGITGIKVNDNEYIFRKNIFGDVTHIYDTTGNLVGQYEYTAYGECTILVDTNGIATYNPIRYRGYYFDTETNLYYLINRYYDPQTCRFVSRDDISYADPETINGLNLYAYCGNNPVMNADPSGTAWEWLSNTWNSVKNWARDTFGAVKEFSYNVWNRTKDFFIGGYEWGVNAISQIGDANKPITFFVKRPEVGWHFWKYQVGVEVNIGNVQVSSSIGLSKRAMSIGNGVDSAYIFAGVNKFGFGISHVENGVMEYKQFYLKTLRLVGLLLLPKGVSSAYRVVPKIVAFFVGGV
ncbi:MAG: hypothetical protein IJY57_00975 [Clostridia bacterium]|nr:hypothetical protein [Clostridia bacterium]